MDTIQPPIPFIGARNEAVPFAAQGAPALSAGDLDPRDGIAANNQGLQRMGVRIGSLNLLFPWDAGREVIPPPPVSRLPNTASWLQGLANVRGGLVPVVDAAAAFGVARESSLPTYLLIFGRGDTALGLLIDGLPRLIGVDPLSRLPDLPEGPALLEGGIAAAYDHAGQPWMEVDLDPLFDTLARHIAL